MLRVSGSVLKKEGVIVIATNKKAVIKWKERSSRKRNYYYLVRIHGDKFTKPSRLKPYEIDYWVDQLKKQIEWREIESKW